MLKRVAAIGSSTAVIGALLTGALSTPALAAPCGTGTYSGGDGTSASPYLLSVAADVTEVKNTSGDWGCVFALTGDINMGGATWSGASGETIGTSATKFTGTFNGGGYTISGLTINGGTSYDYMGLFGYTDGATISNLGFSGAVSGDDEVGGLIGQADNTTVTNSWASGDVTGDDDYVGGLIGESDGSTVTNSRAEGAVQSNGSSAEQVGGLIGRASATTVDGSRATGSVTVTGGSDNFNVGGLVGYLRSNSTVTGSWATGTVRANDDHVGGLIGYHTTSSLVIDSWATGDVSGDDEVGGLIGHQSSSPSVAGSWATGNVTGADDFIGGLIGDSDGSVSTSWASGAVIGDANIGGLVGEANSGAQISNSYATGNITSTDEDAGGLVGDNEGTITRSFALGSVTGVNYLGGLVGVNNNSAALIEDSYARGQVVGTGQYVGGLVGDNENVIRRSYSTGSVTGGSDVGGLVGFLDVAAGASVSDSYWDTQTSGLGASDGGTGKTTAEMQDVTTYAGWSIAQGFNSSLTWAICLNVNSGYPYLTWSYSSDPCVTEVNYQFTFRLPDGTECGAIGPVGVIDGTIYILPGEDADCRTMEGALVGGWTIPVPEGYDSIGSPAMPFAPGQKVRVSDSQQFTVVPFEPLLSLTLDSNVMTDETCEANEVEFVDEANREEYSWVPRGDISMARLPMVAACQPPGYTLAGWNTASDGSGTMFEPGAGLPSEWATDKTNRYRLFAIWSPA